MFEILTLVSHNFLNISRMVNTTDYISDCALMFLWGYRCREEGKEGREGGGRGEGGKGRKGGGGGKEEEKRRYSKFSKIQKKGGYFDLIKKMRKRGGP